MVAKGLGELDKSGVAELTSKIAINIPATTFNRLLLPVVLDSFKQIGRLPDE
jgi:hypothetical protein